MREQKQTILDFINGNCFATGIACLLEIPLETIPNFCAGPNDYWFRDASLWLKEKGYGLISLNFPTTNESGIILPDLPCLITGHSPRNVEKLHCVVGRIEHIYTEDKRFTFTVHFVHDPHPSNDFVTDIIELNLLVRLT